MKKLVIMSALFFSLVGFAKAVEIQMTQGQGTVYGHTDSTWAYSGPSGEITPVHSMLLWGYITSSGDITVDVDTDVSSDIYHAGDLPSNLGDFCIDLL